jgi:molybdopterin/thiamine biosynthesis adenylyltransferase/rhodanese-related sulfurtransferase
MNTRYAAQMRLPQVGGQGQAQLAAAHALVIGAGGLGCALLPWLAGAGVGRITVIDPDRVELGNLHRQPLYRMADLGAPKARAACAALTELNPEVRVVARVEALSPANVAALVADADVVLDAADNFAATYTLSDTCHVLGKPLVSASALGLGGYVGVFCAGAPSYRAVFPQLPTHGDDCASAGVLGPVVALLGALQAQFALALLLRLEPSPLGRLFSWDAKRLRFGGCGFEGAAEPVQAIRFVAPSQVEEADVVIDLRSLAEAPQSPLPQALRSRLDELPALLPTLPHGPRIVLCCRTGMRAARAATLLARHGYEPLALLAFGNPDWPG